MSKTVLCHILNFPTVMAHCKLGLQIQSVPVVLFPTVNVQPKWDHGQYRSDADPTENEKGRDSCLKNS